MINRSFMCMLLDQFPYIGKLRRTNRQLIREIQMMKKAEGEFPSGHYHSPIPNEAEIISYINRKIEDEKFVDIALNEGEQYSTLLKLSKYYKEMSFSEHKNEKRYYFLNGFFSYTDGIILYSFLRKVKPQRIIEVGSGFSSALILDVVDGFYQEWPEITFIEPNPDRLKELLRKSDVDKIKVIEKEVQAVDVQLFESLTANDLLFIDSSHVVKCGSDVQFLLFDILPKLEAGVFVHFHDVFFGFEYPFEWLQNGIYWNESYFLRAFLAYNSHWKIFLHAPFVVENFYSFIESNMPLCLNNSGGSIYIQKIK